MKQRLIAANWKMNGSLQANAALVKAILSLPGEGQRVICPPAVFVSQVGRLIESTNIALGAQNLDWRGSGAVTGEVSAAMLQDLGVKFVIVGHSERRSFFAETDEVCRDKALAAQAAGLTPIFCIGESKEQRDAGEALAVISKQIELGLAGVPLNKLVIAYEPIWAIGTGDTATPDQAEEVHSHIRAELMSIDSASAEEVKILYGGSVNAGNAASLFVMDNIDGALVGGASLKAEEFSAICCAG